MGGSWTEKQEADLRKLWADNSLSCVAIGKIIGKSKNAVCCKAKRIGLPHRASPIRFIGMSGKNSMQRRGKMRISGPTLPPLPSLQGL